MRQLKFYASEFYARKDFEARESGQLNAHKMESTRGKVMGIYIFNCEFRILMVYFKLSHFEVTQHEVRLL